MHQRWGTGRTEAFSDGVFAIAITLLVLEIAVPEEDFTNLWHGIAQQWPSYLAYVTSFLTIGGIWLSHHALFGRLQLVERGVMRLNLLLLMTVSFLPFPTRLVAESIEQADAERAAVIFYGAVLLTISLLVAAMWRAVAAQPDLLVDGVSSADVQRIANGAAPSLMFYAAVIVVAIAFPQVAAFGYLVIAIAAVITARGEDAGAERRRRRRGRRRRSTGNEAADAQTPGTE